MAQSATRSLGRLSEIAQVMVRHGFGYFLEAHKLTDLLPGRSAGARQRPGARRQIEADLVLLYQAARLVKERVRALDFIDAHALIDEFARQIRQELDYRLEGRNAQTVHRNFAGDPHVHVPKVYWTYTRTRVLTLEWLEGTRVRDVDVTPLTLDERRD